jgi:hypothetical protein
MKGVAEWKNFGNRTVLTCKRGTRNMIGWTNKMDGTVREKKGLKKNSTALVRKQTIPTVRLLLVSKVSANFSRQRASRGQRNESPWLLISVF